jgi:hypothetical protein
MGKVLTSAKRTERFGPFLVSNLKIIFLFLVGIWHLHVCWSTSPKVFFFDSYLCWSLCRFIVFQRWLTFIFVDGLHVCLVWFNDPFWGSILSLHPFPARCGDFPKRMPVCPGKLVSLGATENGSLLDTFQISSNKQEKLGIQPANLGIHKSFCLCFFKDTGHTTGYARIRRVFYSWAWNHIASRSTIPALDSLASLLR